MPRRLPPGPKPAVFWALKHPVRAPIQTRHRKTIYCGKRRGRLNAAGAWPGRDAGLLISGPPPPAPRRALPKEERGVITQLRIQRPAQPSLISHPTLYTAPSHLSSSTPHSPLSSLIQRPTQTLSHLSSSTPHSPLSSLIQRPTQPSLISHPAPHTGPLSSLIQLPTQDPPCKREQGGGPPDGEGCNGMLHRALAPEPSLQFRGARRHTDTARGRQCPRAARDSAHPRAGGGGEHRAAATSQHERQLR
jgi:hypothetical protein